MHPVPLFHSGGICLCFPFLSINQQRNFVVTVGEDEQVSPQLSAVCLKVFDLDKMQPEGPSTSGPECIQILRIFTNQFPEAKVLLVVSLFGYILSSI